MSGTHFGWLPWLHRAPGAGAAAERMDERMLDPFGGFKAQRADATEWCRQRSARLGFDACRAAVRRKNDCVWAMEGSYSWRLPYAPAARDGKPNHFGTAA